MLMTVVGLVIISGLYSKLYGNDCLSRLFLIFFFADTEIDEVTLFSATLSKIEPSF